MTTFHVAPHSTRANPQDPSTYQFGQGWVANAVAYILFKAERSRPTRVVVSFGEVGVDVGQEVRVRDDQTNHLLGTYEVVGIVHYDHEGYVAYDEGPYGDLSRTLATGSMK
jgi:hypothetical protein